MRSTDQIQQIESQVICSELGKGFTNHPLLNKDIWSFKELGFSEENINLSSSKNVYFEDFNLSWLKYLSKFTGLVFSSESDNANGLTIHVNTLRNLDKFLVKKGYLKPELITSNILNNFINDGKSQSSKRRTIKYATDLWREEGWLDIDYVHRRIKRSEPKVEIIPEDILLKFYNNLDIFPEPLERLLRLQIALGNRIKEMLLMPRECLKQEGSKWYLKNWIAKRKKWEFIEIHLQIVEIVKAQQKFLDEQFDDSVEFNYLFCQVNISEKDYPKGRFKTKVNYYPKLLSYDVIHQWIKDFRKEANLVDQNGKVFPLTSHMLRRTMASIMANCEVPDVIIASVLGHGSLDMLPHYRKINLEKSIKSKNQTKTYVNQNGNITSFKPTKTRHERLSELLKSSIPIQLGECHRPSMLGDCTKRSGCFKCEHYRMTVEDKPYLKADIEKARQGLAVASKSGQTRNINDLKQLIQIMEDWLKGIEKIETELEE